MIGRLAINLRGFSTMIQFFPGQRECRQRAVDFAPARRQFRFERFSNFPRRQSIRPKRRFPDCLPLEPPNFRHQTVSKSLTRPQSPGVPGEIFPRPAMAVERLKLLASICFLQINQKSCFPAS